jgi:hypothetical protein
MRSGSKLPRGQHGGQRASWPLPNRLVKPGSGRKPPSCYGGVQSFRLPAPPAPIPSTLVAPRRGRRLPRALPLRATRAEGRSVTRRSSAGHDRPGDRSRHGRPSGGGRRRRPGWSQVRTDEGRGCCGPVVPGFLEPVRVPEALQGRESTAGSLFRHDRHERPEPAVASLAYRDPQGCRRAKRATDLPGRTAHLDGRSVAGGSPGWTLGLSAGPGSGAGRSRRHPYRLKPPGRRRRPRGR